VAPPARAALAARGGGARRGRGRALRGRGFAVRRPPGRLARQHATWPAVVACWRGARGGPVSCEQRGHFTGLRGCGALDHIGSPPYATRTFLRAFIFAGLQPAPGRAEKTQRVGRSGIEGSGARPPARPAAFAGPRVPAPPGVAGPGGAVTCLHGTEPPMAWGACRRAGGPAPLQCSTVPRCLRPWRRARGLSAAQLQVGLFSSIKPARRQDEGCPWGAAHRGSNARAGGPCVLAPSRTVHTQRARAAPARCTPARGLPGLGARRPSGRPFLFRRPTRPGGT